MSKLPPIELPVREIEVGNRIRKDPGNVLGLAESIKRVGLLHPVVVNSRKELIAGFRRLKAVKKLGWDTVPVRMVETLDDATAALKAELYENTDREDLKPSEIVEAGKKIEELEGPDAEKRKHENLKKPGKSPKGKISPSGNNGKTRDKVGAAFGISGRTYEKAKEVVESGDAEAIAEMDETGKVDPAYRKVKEKEQEPAADPLAVQAQEYTAEINLFVRRLDELQRNGKELAAHPLAKCVHWHSILDQLKAARGAAATGRPKYKCPYCKATGTKDGRKCRGCDGQGWVHKTTYKSGCAAVGCPDESDGEADE